MTAKIYYTPSRKEDVVAARRDTHKQVLSDSYSIVNEFVPNKFMTLEMINWL